MDIKSEEAEIRRLGKDEIIKFRELIDLFNEVFETGNTEPIDETYLAHLLGNPYFIVYAVIHNDKILGGAAAYILPMYHSRSSELFIYDVAIHPRSQRKGLGTKLISALKGYCLQNDISEMFVPAQEEDKHALKFYAATGGIAGRVVHFNYSVKNKTGV